MRLLIVLCFSFLVLPLIQAQKNVLEKIISRNQAEFGAWAQDPEQYEVQVLYTQIDRDKNGQPQFTSYRWGVDPNRYFYPASTVKMPAAFMALEKLNQLGIVGLNKHTPMRTGAETEPQTPVLTDGSAASLLPSVGHYIRKIFLVSDNDAFNRLYEFLGQRYVNESLREKGLTDTRIIHRLSVSGYDTLGNRLTNPVTFYNDQKELYHQGEVYSMFYDDLGLSQQIRGVAYIDSADEKVDAPFDFRYKNFISIQDLHDMLKAVIFPEAVAPEARFDLTADDYTHLYRAMLEFPQESDYPKYDDPDNYVKFWIYGDQEEDTAIPKHLRILNKVGWAYGFLTDVSYIIDLENQVEFFLVGTIHVNANQTFNDGVYEYEEIGLPFFGELGRTVYEHELNRRRKHAPDLSRFQAILDAQKKDE